MSQLWRLDGVRHALSDSKKAIEIVGSDPRLSCERHSRRRRKRIVAGVLRVLLPVRGFDKEECDDEKRAMPMRLLF
jgi:hypothetical protein